MRKPRFFLPLIIFVFLSCTDNPFFSDDANTIDRHLVRGQVILADGKSPEGIYVWLDSLNLSTRTASNGDFSLSIPKTDSLKGYNSAMRLYYYVGNYKIAFSSVLVRDGLFEYGKYDITGEGRIKSTTSLSPVLEVTTDVSPALIPGTESRSLTVNVTLKKVDSTVMVYTEMNRDLILGSFILRPEGVASDQAIRYSNPGVSLKAFYIDSSMTWQGEILILSGMLSIGQYELYPYIVIQPAELPDGLLESFGKDASKFTDNYLKIPFRHKAANLTIN